MSIRGRAPLAIVATVAITAVGLGVPTSTPSGGDGADAGHVASAGKAGGETPAVAGQRASGARPTARPPEIPIPVGCATAPTHDFGAVIAGEDVYHVFELPNNTTAALKIEKVYATCGCTVAEDWAPDVPASGVWLLPVTLHTDRLSGDTRKTVVVEIAGAEPIEFVLEGHVQPHFDIAPPLGFIFACPGGASPGERKVTITNELSEPVRITAAKTDHPAFHVDLREIDAGRRYEVIATLTGELGDQQRLDGRVTLTTTSPYQPEIVLPIIAFRVSPMLRPVGRALPAESPDSAAGEARPASGGWDESKGRSGGRNSRYFDKDPETYDQMVVYNLNGNHHWHIPIMAALDRDATQPPDTPLPWITGTGLGPYLGDYLEDYVARVQLPYGLVLEPPPYQGPIPPAGVRLIRFFGPGCAYSERDPLTGDPPTHSAAQAAADAYCALMCGDGYTMTDFDMNQWDIVCYNFDSHSYKVVTWGGTRCGKVVGNTVYTCDPQSRLTQVRAHLWQSPIDECPECDLDGDGVISLIDVVLARNSGFVPQRRGLGLTYPALYPTDYSYVDEVFDPAPFVRSDVELIPVTYMDITEWHGWPVDCNTPEMHTAFLGDIFDGGLNHLQSESWCGQFGGAPFCDPQHLGFMIGHCRVNPDGTHSVRVVFGYCLKCVN
jgi:hypothetical protein